MRLKLTHGMCERDTPQRYSKNFLAFAITIRIQWVLLRWTFTCYTLFIQCHFLFPQVKAKVLLIKKNLKHFPSHNFSLNTAAAAESGSEAREITMKFDYSIIFFFLRLLRRKKSHHNTHSKLFPTFIEWKWNSSDDGMGRSQKNHKIVNLQSIFPLALSCHWFQCLQ